MHDLICIPELLRSTICKNILNYYLYPLNYIYCKCYNPSFCGFVVIYTALVVISSARNGNYDLDGLALIQSKRNYGAI